MTRSTGMALLLESQNGCLGEGHARLESQSGEVRPIKFSTQGTHSTRNTTMRLNPAQMRLAGEFPVEPGLTIAFQSYSHFRTALRDDRFSRKRKTYRSTKYAHPAYRTR